MAARRMTHRCAGRPGCQTHIGMSRLMCGSCWNAVPKPLRDEIMRTWDPRGGIRQSDEYHTAVTAARKYLAPPSPELPL